MASRLLRLIGPLHIAGGLLLFATGFFPSAQEPIRILLTSDSGPTWSPFLAAVLGPTIASWGVLFTTLANQYVASPTRRLWRAMAWSVAIWAPLDTLLCLRFGAYNAAILNGAVVVALIAILAAVRPMAYRLMPPPHDYV